MYTIETEESIRADATNLARNYLENAQKIALTGKGMMLLALCVLELDEKLKDHGL